MHRLGRYIALGAPERRLQARVLVLVVAVRFALWVMPYRVISGALRQLSGRCERDAFDIATLARSVRRAAAVVPTATCLTQALATRTLLERRGIACELRLGVGRNSEGSFEAHAWVEVSGRIVIGGAGVRRYTPLTTMPGGF